MNAFLRMMYGLFLGEKGLPIVYTCNVVQYELIIDAHSFQASMIDRQPIWQQMKNKVPKINNRLSGLYFLFMICLWFLALSAD